jgi:hypothetical protein
MRAQYLVLLFSLSYSIVYGQSWTVTEMSSMPEPVSNNAVASAKVGASSFVYSFAGIDSSKLYSGMHLKGFRYDVSADSWDTLPPLPDTLGKIAASASSVKNQIYIIGGYHVFADGHEVSSDRVHRFDPATNTYLSDGAKVPVPIDDQVQVVWRDSLIYVVTGWSQIRNVTNVQIYNPSTDTWMAGTPVPNQDSYRSFGSSGVIVGDTIFYFGGASSNGTLNFPIQNRLRMGIIDANDPSIISWSDTILDPSLVGYRMASVLVEGNIHWIGGANRTYNFDGIAYSNGQAVEPNNRNLFLDPKRMKWDSDTSTSTPFPMDLRSLGKVSSSTLYIAGGMEANQKVSDKMLKLEFVKNSFSLSDFSKFRFELYPNPARNEVALYFEGTALDVEILDAQGRVIKSFQEIESGTPLPVSKLSKGLYYVKINESLEKLVIY